jgi:hypothetical protein
MLLLDAPFYGVSPSGTEFFTGTSAASSLVPDTWHVALNGRPYMIDLNQPFYRQYRRQLAQLIRTQADTSTDPGDQTMDPNSLWRRSYQDWSKGAGQRYLDRPAESGAANEQGSLPDGFWRSKGIDALTTKWQISLLPDITQIKITANTNAAVAVAGTHIYLIDGQALQYATSVGSGWTTVTGTPGATASSICTDGFNVWVAYGAAGVYTTTEGAATATQYVTSPVDAAAIVGYCNGRLMLASTNKIYNIIAAGALPAALFTAGNPNMVYCGFAEGNGAIYAGAHAGNRSWLYGMTVTTDGTALGAPVVQGQLPPGETVTAVYGALGFLIVGSSLGVRMCSTASSGAVTLGSLITTPAAVGCLTGYNRFVWFGYTTYDSVSSGLGKLDLQNHVISNVLPAYCSDLMVPSQAAVPSCAAYNGSLLFTVSGLGVYAPSTTQLVASGTVDSGYVMYDLTDNKVACLLDMQTAGPLSYGSYSAFVSTDTGAFAAVGTHVSGNPEPVTFAVGPVTGQRFEVRVQLNRDATILTAGPTLTRWTLRSYPAPKRPLTWQLPLILNENVSNRSGQDQGFDPLVELQALEAMGTAGRMVNFQEGHVSYSVFVQDVEFLPDYTEENRTNNYFNGIALVQLVGLPVQA